MADPKPLPPGNYRLVCVCHCGRRIPEDERIELVRSRPCPECAGTVRYWEPVPVGWLTKLRYWWALRQWKRRQHA